MSGKRLLPLAGLLLLLIIAAVLFKRQPPPHKLVDEAGFELLVPPELHVERINGLDFYRGSHPEKVLRLRRQGKGWVVASHYEAPVRAEKITRLLDTLRTLAGELRADKADLLDDFRLETSQALHLQVYTTDIKTPVVHLLAGKGQGANGFMRLADDNRVYSVNLNLYNEVGLYGDPKDRVPEAKPWMDLRLLNVPQEQVTAVALHTPTQHWRFVRQPSSPPAAKTSQATSPAAAQWVLAEPEVKYAVKQRFLDGLISTLRTGNAEDIADPAHIAAYGLNEAAYTATLTIRPHKAQKTHQVSLWIGNEVPKQTGKRYARLGQKGPVYILPSWVFHRLFPKGKDLLDLPGLQLKEADIQHITLFTPTRTIRLARPIASTTAEKEAKSPSAWVLVSSPPPFTVRQDGVQTLARRLATFTPDDLAPVDSSVPPPSSKTLSRVELSMRDTSHYVLRLGPPIAGHPQWYSLYLNDQTTPFAIDQPTRDDLLPPLRTLLNLHLFRFQPQDIKRVTWQHNGASRTLERHLAASPTAADVKVPAGWQLLDMPQVPVNASAVDTVLTTITHLTADDWFERPTPQIGFEHPTLSLTLTLRNGRTTQLALGSDAHNSYARVDGIPGLCVIPTATYHTLLETVTTHIISTHPAAPATPPTQQHPL